MYSMPLVLLVALSLLNGMVSMTAGIGLGYLILGREANLKAKQAVILGAMVTQIMLSLGYLAIDLIDYFRFG